MKNLFKKTGLLALLTIALISCKKDKTTDPTPSTPPPPANEEEVITTMKLILEDTTSNSTYEYIFKDLDGDGGNPGIYGGTNQSDSVINLTAGKVYRCEILLLNETKNPADTISNEVKEEANDHMFFFGNGYNSTLSTNPLTVQINGSLVTIKYLDLDTNSPAYGIGLKTLWTCPSSATSKSKLNIVLKHQPGTKNGTYAPGETDVDILFKVKVN